LRIADRARIAAKTAPVRVPVAVTYRVLGFSKQAFYQWRKQPVTQRDRDDAALINAALDVHHDDPEFGYRLITDELRDLGHVAKLASSAIDDIAR